MSDRIVTIAEGISVRIKQPYTEGHPLTPAEADKLNGLLVETIRGALSSRFKKASADGKVVDAAALSSEFQTYSDSYSFSLRVAKAPQDPVQKEAYKIAKELVFAGLRNNGKDPNSYSNEQITNYITVVLERKPEVLEEAKRRVESAKSIAENLIDID